MTVRDGQGLRGPDKRQGGLRQDTAGTPSTDLPEGLQRPRKGPIDKNLGRNQQAATPHVTEKTKPAPKYSGL